MKFRALLRVMILMVVVTLLVAACGGDDDSDKQDDKVETASVVVQLNWLHDPAWAGLYVAETEGYYADEKLDVELRTVFDVDGNFISTTGVVASGEAQFGVEDSAIFLEAIADGAELVAIATIYQRHPLVFTSLAENNITTPHDLIGKTVHVSVNSNAIYRALLAAEGIDPNSVNYVERTDYTEQSLLAGEADVIDAWVVNEVAILVVEGQEFNIISPAEYGIEVYPNVIFTTQQMIAEQPELVQRFVNATVQGLQTVHNDVELSINATSNYMREASPEIMEESLHRALPLIKPVNSEPGMMTREVWESSHGILLEQEILSEPLDLDAVYTLEFLNTIYE